MVINYSSYELISAISMFTLPLYIIIIFMMLTIIMYIK